MNKDAFEDKRKQVNGQATERWGKLTHDNREQESGETPQLIGLVQLKYGSIRGCDREEFNRLLKKA
jgi:uncharacterized protein YjbJ (UPF0337 family)